MILIAEDPLNQLQCIRESLMQMKNPGIHNQTFGAANFANSLVRYIIAYAIKAYMQILTAYTVADAIFKTVLVVSITA